LLIHLLDAFESLVKKRNL